MTSNDASSRGLTHMCSSLKGSESRSPTSETETADLAYDSLKVRFTFLHSHQLVSTEVRLRDAGVTVGVEDFSTV